MVLPFLSNDEERGREEGREKGRKKGRRGKTKRDERKKKLKNSKKRRVIPDASKRSWFQKVSKVLLCAELISKIHSMSLRDLNERGEVYVYGSGRSILTFLTVEIACFFMYFILLLRDSN